MRASLPSLLLAESARYTRGGGFVGLRVAHAAAAAAAMLVMGVLAGEADPAAPATLGLLLFVQYRDVLLVLVVLVGPLLAAIGGVEERATGALDLLRLTPLTARQVLWGRVAARLLVPVSIALASVPLLLPTLGMGGVAVAEVVATLVNAMALLLVIAPIATLLALRTGRAVPAVLVAASWGAIASFGSPRLYLDAAAAVEAASGLALGASAADLSPVIAMWTPSGAGPVAALVVVGLVVDRWVVSPRAARIAALGGAVAWAGGWALPRLVPLLAIGPQAVGWALWIAAVAGLAAITVAMLEIGQWLLSPPAGHARRSRTVRGNPVTWRELATRADGAGPVAALVSVGWAAAVLSVWWVGTAPGNGTRISSLELPFTLMITGVVATIIAAVPAGAADREGADDLLDVTPLSRGSIVRGRMAGVAVRSLPLLFLGAVLRDPAFALWIVPFWAFVALGATVIARRAPSEQVALALALGLAMVYFVGVAQLELVDGGVAVRALLAPPIVVERPVRVDELAGSSLALALAAGALGWAAGRERSTASRRSSRPGAGTIGAASWKS